MIKARACAGDIAAGEAILNELAPFVWRKYLDFVAVADVHAMKRQINAYRGHGEIAVEGHNIKLGRGGIREIEFFAQTQQLIAGGRNPGLRDRDTLTTLDKLCDDRWIDAGARDDMKEAYGFLRTVEHRLQMVNDEQTQTLPAERAGARALRALSGLCRPRRFRQGAARPSRQGAALLFAPVRKDARRRPAGAGFPAGCRRPQDARSAGRARFPRAAGSLQHRAALACRWSSLAQGRGGAQPSRGLLPVLLEHLARTDNPGATLVLFDHFLANLHGAARLLSLLRQNPDLIALIALRARHRAAARRHAGAQSAGDGRAGRSELFRRLAGRRWSLAGDSMPRSRNRATTKTCSNASACSGWNTCS